MRKIFQQMTEAVKRAFRRIPAALKGLKEATAAVGAWLLGRLTAAIRWLKGVPSALWQWLRAFPGKVLRFARGIPTWPGKIRAWLKELREGFKRVIRVGLPFWKGNMRRRGFILLVLALAFVALNAFVNNALVDAQEPYNTHMKNGPLSAFWSAVLLYVVWMVAWDIVQACSNITRTALVLTIRKWLSGDLISLWMKARNYLKYTRDKNPAKPDNPSQRNSQDPDTYANNTVNLFFSALDSLMAVAIFGHKLWTVYHQIVYLAVAVSVLTSLMTWLLGKSLGRLVNTQYKTEADLRATLLDTESSAEDIALAHGEDLVKENADNNLANIISTLMSIGWLNFRLQLYNNLMSPTQLVPVIPILVVIPLYFEGKIPVGELAAVSAGFTSLTTGLTWFANQFGGIMTYFTVTKRIDDMYLTLNGYMAEKPAGERIEVNEGPVAAFEHVCINNALGKRVVEDLTVQFEKSTLILGTDNAGKSWILKVLAGVFDDGSGKATLLPQGEFLVLSQRTWLPKFPCTLKRVLCFGLDHCPDDATALEVLNWVNLGSLAKDVGGLHADQTKTWGALIPGPAQQQRLNLARVIMACLPDGVKGQPKPKVVGIDQATATLEEGNEELVYTLLAKKLGCLLISTATGIKLSKYHQQILEIKVLVDEDGNPRTPEKGEKNWQLCPADEYKPEEPKRVLSPWARLLVALGLLDDPHGKLEEVHAEAHEETQPAVSVPSSGEGKPERQDEPTDERKTD